MYFKTRLRYGNTLLSRNELGKKNKIHHIVFVSINDMVALKENQAAILGEI